MRRFNSINTFFDKRNRDMYTLTIAYLELKTAKKNRHKSNLIL